MGVCEDEERIFFDSYYCLFMKEFMSRGRGVSRFVIV